MGHSIKKGVKIYPNHTGPQRGEKDMRRAWPSHILGTACADGNGWFVGPDGNPVNVRQKLRRYKRMVELKAAQQKEAIAKFKDRMKAMKPAHKEAP